MGRWRPRRGGRRRGWRWRGGRRRTIGWAGHRGRPFPTQLGRTLIAPVPQVYPYTDGAEPRLFKMSAGPILDAMQRVQSMGVGTAWSAGSRPPYAVQTSPQCETSADAEGLPSSLMIIQDVEIQITMFREPQPLVVVLSLLIARQRGLPKRMCGKYVSPAS